MKEKKDEPNQPEPSSVDLMWVDRDDCEHEFEKLLIDDEYEIEGTKEDPKQALSHWRCIVRFNKFVADEQIQVKTKKLCLTDFNGNRLYDKGVLEFELKFTAEVASPPISNEYYVNFDRSTKQFVNVDNCLTVDMANSLDAASHTVCMICLCKIVESKVAICQHLKECTGVKFVFKNDMSESLPIFKIV